MKRRDDTIKRRRYGRPVTPPPPPAPGVSIIPSISCEFATLSIFSFYPAAPVSRRVITAVMILPTWHGNYVANGRLNLDLGSNQRDFTIVSPRVCHAIYNIVPRRKFYVRRRFGKSIFLQVNCDSCYAVVCFIPFPLERKFIF